MINLETLRRKVVSIIIVPKVIQPVDTKQALIFLAGPIRGGGDWQRLMAEMLIEQDPYVQIACPARWTAEHTLNRYFVQPFSEAEIRQLHWERHYMELASLSANQRGCVLFWLGLEDCNNPHPGPEPFAMDTRRELGTYTAFIKLLGARVAVGGSEGFYGLSVFRDELNNAAGGSFPFYTTMETLTAAALKIASKL